MNTGNKNSLPKWIKKIQQQSWQIEILIASGLIIFLYNIPHYLFNFLIDYEESALPRAEPVILFFGAFIFSRALLLGFVATFFYGLYGLHSWELILRFRMELIFKNYLTANFSKKKLKNQRPYLKESSHWKKFAALPIR